MILFRLFSAAKSSTTCGVTVLENRALRQRRCSGRAMGASSFPLCQCLNENTQPIRAAKCSITNPSQGASAARIPLRRSAKSNSMTLERFYNRRLGPDCTNKHDPETSHAGGGVATSNKCANLSQPSLEAEKDSVCCGWSERSRGERSFAFHCKNEGAADRVTCLGIGRR
jgi:hypothetical protein